MAIEMTVFVKTDRTRFRLERFHSENNVLILPSSGRFRVREGDTWSEVGPLEAYRFSQGHDYERTVVEPITIYNFRFRDDEELLPDGKITFRDTQRVASTLCLLDACERCDPATAFRYQRALFGDLANQYTIEHGAESTPAKDTQMQAAIRFLEENAHDAVSLPAVAEQSGLSYVQFSRRFKAATGTTPIAYLTRLRMRKARQLLASTELPVSAIASACGYNSEYYFSNCFKKYHRLSPSEYRRALHA